MTVACSEKSSICVKPQHCFSSAQEGDTSQGVLTVAFQCSTYQNIQYKHIFQRGLKRERYRARFQFELTKLLLSPSTIHRFPLSQIHSTCRHQCGRKYSFFRKGEGRDCSLDNFDFLVHHQRELQFFCRRTFNRIQEVGNSSSE